MPNAITFGTDGWRDLIAEGFTFANVRIVAAAIADYVKGAYPGECPVLVGYDTRFLAREFAETVVAILQDRGLKTLLAERDVPTPVIAFAARELRSAGAVMLTASHNPAGYCGIKYIPDYAGPATKDITDQIVANVKALSASSLTFPKTRVVGEQFDPMPSYLKWVQQMVPTDSLRKAKLRVVYDALYSTGRGYLDALLTHYGCDVTLLHGHRDPLFGGGMPEPAVSQLGELISRVQSEGADLGFATDGDADRFGVVDAEGTFYTPNQVIALLLRHLVKNRGFKGSVVRTVATTHLIDRLAAHYGVAVRETPVGFKWVGEAMRQEPVVIGGEESGGLSILGHIPEKDGILANLLVAEMVAFEGKPLKDIWAELVGEVGWNPANRRLDLHLTQEAKEAVLRQFLEHTPTTIAGLKVQSMDRKDGVKLVLQDGSWVLVRPSGTEPIIRAYLEAASMAELEKLAQDVQRIVSEASGPVAVH